MVWGIFQFFFRASGVLPSASDLDLRGAQFASRYLKRVALESGKSIGDAKVIHWGLDVSQYPDKPASRHPHKLLYVGQIVEHKGVHTAVEALKILIEKYGRKATTLTIAGGSVIKPEETRVRNMVRDFGLENNVRLTGLLPREELPAVYQEHDIFLFPSVWDEPFGITLLESMASGLPVVGTGTGGSAEITQHEQNALLYPKGDAEACAAQVVRLMDDPTLFERMQQNGRRTVEEKFRFETTMDSIENALGEALS
jgi:glycosyltransferase involved in cell wall biosynthesis